MADTNRSAERETYDPELKRFWDGAVHDLRSALRHVGISAELLQGKTDEASVPVLNRISANVTKMDAILSSIVGYVTALEIKLESLKPVKMDLAVHTALASLEQKIREHEAVVTHAPLPEVTGDLDRLAHVMRELIHNALVYRSAAPVQIGIGAARDEAFWKFSVSDNGIGIDRQYWPKLFVPFSRLHGSEIPGVGLGLATCKKILESHGGKIWLDSEPRVGSTFFFTLPAGNRNGNHSV